MFLVVMSAFLIIIGAFGLRNRKAAARLQPLSFAHTKNLFRSIFNQSVVLSE